MKEVSRELLSWKQLPNNEVFYYADLNDGSFAVFHTSTKALAYTCDKSFLLDSDPMDKFPIAKGQIDYGIIKNRQELDSVDFIPTYRCDIACRYCYVSQDQCCNSSDLTLDEIELALKILADNMDSKKIPSISIIGGEPSVARNVVFDVINSSRKKFEAVSIVVVSNGLGWSDDDFISFANNDVFLVISLDGRREAHDAVRVHPNGSGTFDEVCKAIVRAKECGCRVGLCVTVGQHNLGTFIDDVVWMVDTFNPDDVHIDAMLHPLSDKPNPLQVPIELFAECLFELFEAGRSGRLPRHLFRWVDTFLPSSRGRDFSCPAAGRKIVVAPGRRVGTCEGFCHNGNRSFDPHNVDEIVNEVHSWSEAKPTKFHECKLCPLRSFCGGGCRYDAGWLSGSIDSHNLRFCKLQKTIFDWYVLTGRGCTNPEMAGERWALLEEKNFIQRYSGFFSGKPDVGINWS